MSATINPTADADGWISWAGGKCPVAGDVLVETRHRNGEEFSMRAALYDTAADPELAGWWHEDFWTHEGSGSDIIAYRIVQQMTPDTRADAIMLDAYSPLYGWAIGYVSNPATGSLVARYSNDMTRELALPCCAHCDAVLVEGYCAACGEHGGISI